MRNITIKSATTVVHSLSHWGLFLGELIKENEMALTGYDANGKLKYEIINEPVFAYRPLRGDEADLFRSFKWITDIFAKRFNSGKG